MREIQVQKLTKDNFGKYGEFLDLLDESELKKKSIFQEGFFADVVALEFNQGNQPTISVCHVKKQSENIISFLEKRFQQRTDQNVLYRGQHLYAFCCHPVCGNLRLFRGNLRNVIRNLPVRRIPEKRFLEQGAFYHTEGQYGGTVPVSVYNQ